jgi:two-component system response regulator MprA
MILIVDDDADIRDSLQEFFEDEGFRVVTAANGAEALTRLRSGDVPAVIILDLLMPVMDGNEMYEQLQADPALSQLPVIVSTSDPRRAPRGVLTMKKPFNLARLMTAVRQFCSPG